MTDMVSINIAAGLACASFVLVLLNNGAKLLDRIKGQPSQPTNERLGADIAQLRFISENQQKHIDWLDAEISSLKSIMDTKMTAIQQSGEARAGKIHERIDALVKGLSELVGESRRRRDE